MATKKQSATTSTAKKTEAPAKVAKTEKVAAAPKQVKAAPAAAKKVAEPAKAAKKETVKAAPAAKTTKITFVLPKEAVSGAESVAVLGDFNNWQNGVALTKQKDGSFKAAIELEKGRSYEYRFLINGNTWENDWAAEAYVQTPFGTFNSVVTA